MDRLQFGVDSLLIARVIDEFMLTLTLGKKTENVKYDQGPLKRVKNLF